MSRKNSMKEVHADIQTGGVIAVPAGKAPQDAAKARALTQVAIKNLDGPVYASMTDHKPVDTALAQAKTAIAIKSTGGMSVEHAPADRAIGEALTMKAINAGAKDKLKKTDGVDDSGLTPEALAQLQVQAKDEKDKKKAAHTFGGGDAKEGMPNILNEIKGQGGVIAVPAGKAPADDVSLNHTKTLMEINALGGEPIYASGTDHQVEDKGMAMAKTLVQIANKGETSVDASKIETKDGRAVTEAMTMMAIKSDKKAELKQVVA